MHARTHAQIGRSDAALIMKSCASDGKLLQGDKPAMSLDSMHVAKAFECGQKTCDQNHPDEICTCPLLS